MALKGACPLRLLCRVLGVPRNALYYRPKDRSTDPAALEWMRRWDDPNDPELMLTPLPYRQYELLRPEHRALLLPPGW